MKNQSGQNYPLHHQHERGRWGEGDMLPGDSPVCKVAPSGRGGQLGQVALLWSSGHSRPSSELARKVLDLNPIVPLTGSQGAWQGCFVLVSHQWWFLGLLTCKAVLLGSPQQCCLINLHSPATPLFFLLRPEGGGWGVGLPGLVGVSGGVGHIWGSGFPLGLGLLVSQVCRIMGVTGAGGNCRCHDVRGCFGCCGCQGCQITLVPRCYRCLCWRVRPQSHTRKMGWVGEWQDW